MSEPPTTQAGRDLLDRLPHVADHYVAATAILAIEAEARAAALAEREALVGALVEIRETARTPLSGYCQWCDARPDQTHQPDCPAALAIAALAETPEADA